MVVRPSSPCGGLRGYAVRWFEASEVSAASVADDSCGSVFVGVDAVTDLAVGAAVREGSSVLAELDAYDAVFHWPVLLRSRPRMMFWRGWVAGGGGDGVDGVGGSCCFVEGVVESHGGGLSVG